jgi:asparaginyl-tRNA synthetase
LNTSRHLAEFWMIEPEIAFADLSDDATLAEWLLKFTFEALLNERQDDLAFFDERIENGLVAKLQGIVASEFARMDYGEAITVLERAKEKFEFPVKWGIDLQSEHERYLTERYAKEPVIVMNYPKDIKAFYMRLNDDGKNCRGDGRAGAGHRLDHRRQPAGRAACCARRPHGGARHRQGALRLVPRPSRYGTVPHAGFGLGFERTLAYVTGLANVRDAIPFNLAPRSRYRASISVA